MIPNQSRNDPDGITSLGRVIAPKVALITAILAAILSILMIANYVQTKSVDPLKSEALAQLMLRLRENPDDAALKEQIRAVDLLARKAYFLHQWQIRTGSYLLFAFVLFFLLALKYMSSLQPKLPDLEGGTPTEDSWENKLLSRNYILYGGMGIFVLALVCGLLAESELKNSSLDVQKTRQGESLPAQGDLTQAKGSMVAFPKIEVLRSNWPGFRGPEGNGMAYVKDPPSDWDGPSNKNILWKVPVPLPGRNSPVIWSNKIFLSGADKSSQTVFCFDLGSGKILWRSELNDLPGSPKERPRISEDTGYAAPTLITDGRHICAVFSTGDLGCFDYNGKRIWAKNLGVPDNHYGHASSPAIFEDLLLVPFDQNTGGHLLALKLADGEMVYDKGRDVQISWASPIVVDTGSRVEAIMAANPLVISYAPRSGTELWRVKCLSGEVGPSPAYAEGMVFAVNEYARLAGIKLGAKPEVVWEYLDDLSSVSSLAATKDFVINATSYGAVSCFNAKTGERYWLHDFPNGFYSSPIIAGDSVYLLDMNGLTHIFKAGKEFHLIRSCPLGEKAVTIPAFVPGRILIRGENNLFCIGGK